MGDITLLVLGFYDRHNTGDECYKHAFPRVFSSMCKTIVFKCMDDVTEEDVARINPGVVVVGGGDVINDYFMKKAKKVLKGCSCPIYAVSVGIPYKNCAYHLDLFDHVFTRSTRDTKIAQNQIGCENVTQIVDLSMSLSPSAKPQQIENAQKRFRIGICLAQPFFHNNPKHDELMDSIVKCIQEIEASSRIQIEWHLVAFNTNLKNKTEGDAFAIEELLKRFDGRCMKHYVVVDDMEVSNAIAYINESLDMTICMRFHSVMFSLLTATPFVALLSSTKIVGVMQDVDCLEENGVAVVKDDCTYMPTSFDSRSLVEKTLAIIRDYECHMMKAVAKRQALKMRMSLAAKDMNNTMFVDTKRKVEVPCLTNNAGLKRFDKVVERCIECISAFFDMSKDDVRGFMNDTEVAWMEVLKKQGECEDDRILQERAGVFARLVCMCASDCFDSPCHWGMMDAVLNKKICLMESLKYIWDHHCKTL